MYATGALAGKYVCMARCKHLTVHSKQASEPFISVNQGTHLHNNTRSGLCQVLTTGISRVHMSTVASVASLASKEELRRTHKRTVSVNEK